MKASCRDNMHNTPAVNAPWGHNIIGLVKRKHHGQVSCSGPGKPLDRKISHCLPRSMRTKRLGRL